MIRLLLGSALPIVGLGAAAAFLGPDLLTAPRGEPLIMAAPDRPMLQAASFEGGACASAAIVSPPSDADGVHQTGTRIIAFALPSDNEDIAVAVEDFPDGATAARTVVLVFDEDGRLVAAGDAVSLQVQAAIALADCIEAPTTDHRAPI